MFQKAGASPFLERMATNQLNGQKGWTSPIGWLGNSKYGQLPIVHREYVLGIWIPLVRSFYRSLLSPLDSHKELEQDADDEMLLQAASTSDDGPAAKVLMG